MDLFLQVLKITILDLLFHLGILQFIIKIQYYNQLCLLNIMILHIQDI